MIVVPETLKAKASSKIEIVGKALGLEDSPDACQKYPATLRRPKRLRQAITHAGVLYCRPRRTPDGIRHRHGG